MTAQRKISKTINILLWVAQGVLAIILLWVGSMKLFKPEGLPFPWIKENPELVIITGIVDLLGGLGIVLPVALRIRSGLTVWAAYGIIALMIVAMIFHISRGEAQNIGVNIFFLLLAVFVAWGRRSGSVV
ncbi:DoxX family protein [Mucilaginibacter sp. KACC 22063]|uniref:DoxX family protein n=1 Tax=Mucilaginibacter sp. KACC 22063 TaxID=3025666 RepID=UPI0023673502|nr:DoxX family protein [Mucilaginibacter sp. KACC 22063]WDF55588.1 DoxX family protein [Mucilaginibacter sp. KACC 22063]